MTGVQAPSNSLSVQHGRDWSSTTIPTVEATVADPAIFWGLCTSGSAVPRGSLTSGIVLLFLLRLETPSCNWCTVKQAVEPMPQDEQ